MKKAHSNLLVLILIIISINYHAIAQDVSLEKQKTKRTPPDIALKQWEEMPKPTIIAFGNSNTRYTQDLVPQEKLRKSEVLTAWKGEKVHTQILICTKVNIPSVSISSNKLTSENGEFISKKHIKTGFVGYVMTDEFKNGCGHRQAHNFDSSLVADPIDFKLKNIDVSKNNVQAVWVSIQVPANAKPGVYKTNIDITTSETQRLTLTLNVLERTLPDPANWKFNLDLWQHPAAIARIHKVELWSKKHFKLMQPYYNMLANAGQKCITASIVDEPWGHQTYDDYPGLIKWIKKKDGSWIYDYSLFDRYISFVMSCGINKRINCYSMVPWKISFNYFDESLNQVVEFKSGIGTPAYNDFWKNMLTDFTKHLKEKGWFNITAIAMDERPMEAMQLVIGLLKTIDPSWKIALAGDYHPEIENNIYDYCVASSWHFPDSVLKSRRDSKKLSTWYTCCSEKYPNGFTFSPPAEHVWIGHYTAAHQMDGYLRWAYNSWTANPRQDSRFRAWPAGDTYQIYPGPQTCIRFEKLIEGIQDYEKTELLRSEYMKNNDVDKLKELEQELAEFEIKKLQSITAEDMVVRFKKILNKNK